jgi:hypothetical protein
MIPWGSTLLFNRSYQVAQGGIQSEKFKGFKKMI